MVKLLVQRGIADSLVLNAMEKVKRHLFFPGLIGDLNDPYGDHPCCIGYGQTISQPFIVAYMLEKLDLKTGDRVLEIGTGSGYQAAVLHQMGMEVFTIESIPELLEHSRNVLHPAVRSKPGDGWEGWPDEAPFKGIVLSCAPQTIPQKLLKQLDEHGRLILPLGGHIQRLVLVEKCEGNYRTSNYLPVRFVPMINH